MRSTVHGTCTCAVDADPLDNRVYSYSQGTWTNVTSVKWDAASEEETISTILHLRVYIRFTTCLADITSNWWLIQQILITMEPVHIRLLKQTITMNLATLGKSERQYGSLGAGIRLLPHHGKISISILFSMSQREFYFSLGTKQICD